MELDIKIQLDRIERLTLLSAKNVLCLEDVALLTGLSKSHLYKLTCSHQIPFYKPNGKQIYFDRMEVENWMKQNRVATTDEIETKAVNYLVTGEMQAVL
ncbi:helix-turn-helix domain-containing protein [Bacteroides fragilis]|uniref:helix-turn-helix domain-containing protein n=1 Tax=Bacteroides fragilis TaxID=817 RepID=UPI002030ACA4|nr:helix-turn-helix domain-containing protein [Bacteroides fragilis]MCM0343911.1 helix-turn-helix domain-containing protein [Bacteroides fragilis]